ncbi:MAG: hypothetical protein EZS28_012387 [Streblomastix strix]|uniref:AATF leucine zipper-containing domain-containing protein n=1 Tax=Streblomastix strix TaxID=222440 RepID=A0A5J4WAZ5_9EUKA|nr:MAG: hypothetical protein EZS28_012387 [Streblomastix strix]
MSKSGQNILSGYSFDDEADDFDSSVRLEVGHDADFTHVPLPPRVTPRSFAIEGGFYSGTPTRRKDLGPAFARLSKSVEQNIDNEDEDEDEFDNDNSQIGDESSDFENNEEQGSIDILSAAASALNMNDQQSENDEEQENEQTHQEEMNQNDEEMQKALRTVAQKKAWVSLIKIRVAMSKQLSLINKLPQPGSNAFEILQRLSNNNIQQQQQQQQQQSTNGSNEDKTLNPRLQHGYEKANIVTNRLNKSLQTLNDKLSKIALDNNNINNTNTKSNNPKDKKQQQKKPKQKQQSLNEQNKSIKDWVMKTLDEWHSRSSLSKILIHSSSNRGLMRSLNQPISSQIQQIMNNEDRILMRIHMNREGIVPIGGISDKNKMIEKERINNELNIEDEIRNEDDEYNNDDNNNLQDEDEMNQFGMNNKTSEMMKSKQINKDIIDDTDFYQILLRSLLRSSSSSSSSINTNIPQQNIKHIIINEHIGRLDESDLIDENMTNEIKPNLIPFLTPIEIESAQASLQATLKMQHRNKQASIDRKSSKGKSIKYIVHPEIVSFAPPEDWIFPLNTNIIMRGLFGGL